MNMRVYVLGLSAFAFCTAKREKPTQENLNQRNIKEVPEKKIVSFKSLHP